MTVLNHIAAAVLQRVTKQGAEADDLVVRLVTAVIQDDIEGAELTIDLGQKIRVGLAPDTYEYILVCDLVCEPAPNQCILPSGCLPSAMGPRLNGLYGRSLRLWFDTGGGKRRVVEHERPFRAFYF